MSSYVFDQTWKREHARLRALEDLFDGASIRHLAERGAGAGWRCLEVGCGAGGVARWLAERVGASGRVLATDLDLRFLADHGRGNLEVQRHNILTDPLEEGTFDLVHERALLVHVPGRQQALKRMVAAVRPGGWVVAEDPDHGGAMIPALSRYVDPPEHAELWSGSSTGWTGCSPVSAPTQASDRGCPGRSPRRDWSRSARSCIHRCCTGGPGAFCG